jgi:dTMP kinase
MNSIKQTIPGKFIVIEGPEGSGKSLLASELTKALLNTGINCIQSKEPGTVFNGSLRNIILNSSPSKMAELFLFLADRAEHINKVVKPTLEKGSWVILDRFSDSTLIYQSLVKKTVEEDTCKVLCSLSEQNCTPDLKLLLLADFDICQKRLNTRTDQLKRLGQQAGYEQEKLIYDSYVSLKNNSSYILLNGNQPPETVLETALKSIELLPRKVN